MLLREYVLKVEFPPCDFAAQTVNAVAELSDDITEILPYLNTVIKNCTYLPDAHILRFIKDGKAINIYPNKVAITKLRDKEEARQVMESLKSLVNDTYRKRSEIRPSYGSPTELKVRDIYNLLSGTNCRQCGLPTCFAFAAKLIKRQIEITKCTPIYADQYAIKREKLLELLRKHGYP